MALFTLWNFPKGTLFLRIKIRHEKLLGLECRDKGKRKHGDPWEDFLERITGVNPRICPYCAFCPPQTLFTCQTGYSFDKIAAQRPRFESLYAREAAQFNRIVTGISFRSTPFKIFNVRQGKMNTENFIRDVQRFLSVSAVGVSALRRQGVGVIPAIQTYLAELNLSDLSSIRDQTEFDAWLDEQTNAIAAIQHSPSISWGAARKALNLFLRDCLYNKYLSSWYGIEAVEPFLEVPLDSVVSKELRREAGRGRLPPWKGIKQLRSADGQSYQEHARIMAAKKGMHRVHLDVGIWVNNR